MCSDTLFLLWNLKIIRVKPTTTHGKTVRPAILQRRCRKPMPKLPKWNKSFSRLRPEQMATRIVSEFFTRSSMPKKIMFKVWFFVFLLLDCSDQCQPVSLSCNKSIYLHYLLTWMLSYKQCKNWVWGSFLKPFGTHSIRV